MKAVAVGVLVSLMVGTASEARSVGGDHPCPYDRHCPNNPYGAASPFSGNGIIDPFRSPPLFLNKPHRLKPQVEVLQPRSETASYAAPYPRPAYPAYPAAYGGYVYVSGGAYAPYAIAPYATVAPNGTTVYIVPRY